MSVLLFWQGPADESICGAITESDDVAYSEAEAADVDAWAGVQAAPLEDEYIDPGSLIAIELANDAPPDETEWWPQDWARGPPDALDVDDTIAAASLPARAPDGDDDAVDGWQWAAPDQVDDAAGAWTAHDVDGNDDEAGDGFTWSAIDVIGDETGETAGGASIEAPLEAAEDDDVAGVVAPLDQVDDAPFASAAADDELLAVDDDAGFAVGPLDDAPTAADNDRVAACVDAEAFAPDDDVDGHAQGPLGDALADATILAAALDDAAVAASAEVEGFVVSPPDQNDDILAGASALVTDDAAPDDDGFVAAAPDQDDEPGKAAVDEAASAAALDAVDGFAGVALEDTPGVDDGNTGQAHLGDDLAEPPPAEAADEAGAWLGPLADGATGPGPAVGIDVAYVTLKAWTVANWTATALRFENEAQDPPADLSPFVFFETTFDLLEQSEIGSGAARTNVWREEGEAFWHVMVASGTGSRGARGHGEELAQLLKGLALANGVRIEDIEIGAGEDDRNGNWWRLPVTAHWVRDSWKLGSD